MRFIRHPDYQPATAQNDIALLELEQSVDARSVLAPLPFEKAALLEAGRSGLVSGWGRTEPNALGHDVGVNELRYASVQFVSRERCNAPESYAGRVLDGMVCAGDGRTDACRGDSGGPLVVTDEMNSYVGGVVNSGDGCGQANKFGVYTSVPFFAEWLRQYLEQ